MRAGRDPRVPRRTPRAVAAALLAAAVGVCVTGGARAVEVTKIGASAPGDDLLLRTVQSRITGRPGVDSSRVSVDVVHGVLTLGGTVSSLHERFEIEEVSGAVRGIAEIIDNIEIERQGRSDALMEQEVRWAIEASPRLRAAGLVGTVRNAVLVLDGQAPTARDREDAENAAARVKGLTEIVNRIRLVPVPVDPEQIRRRLEHILSNKLIFGRIADLKIDVRPDGTVTLFGTAPTLSEKRTAERVAFGIQGVAGVDNQILLRHYVRP